MGHKASECWQGDIQGAEEVPTSSASSVAPSTVTTTTAPKTTATIQEVANGEDESGWIFGMASGSLEAATRDRDDIWDELVLDSGSVSQRLVRTHGPLTLV